MDIETELRDALTRIPALLLSADDEVVRSDALVSLDVHRTLIERRTVVALVGPSGAGRSWLFNALVKASLSPEGTLRPTTSVPVAAGSRTEAVVGLDVEVQSASEGPDGIVLIDTPAWEHDPDVVRRIVACADVTVVVVSPSRYADASVARLWTEMNGEALLVLNRADVGSATFDVLARSVREVFERRPIVIGENQMSIDHAESQLVVEGSQDSRVKAAICLAAARSAARHLARATARMATDVQNVIFAASQEQRSIVPTSVFTVRDSWLSSKQAMVEVVAREIRDSENRIVGGSADSLGERVLGEIGAWHDRILDADLDSWKDRCRTLFGERASIRWRLGPAERLIDKYSWKIAINEDVVAPRRFRMIMGKQLAEVSAVAHDELQVLIAGSVEERRLKWIERLDELGEYQPGILLALAGSLAGSESRDD